MTKLTAARLDEIKSQARKKSGDWIKVGLSTCGISAGADKVFKALNEEKERRGIEVRIERCGCAGSCYAEPLVEVSVQGLPVVVYGRVDENTAREIIDRHVIDKKLLNDHIYSAKVK